MNNITSSDEKCILSFFIWSEEQNMGHISAPTYLLGQALLCNSQTAQLYVVALIAANNSAPPPYWLRETELLKVLPASHPHWLGSKERAQYLDRDNSNSGWGTRLAGNYILKSRWRCLFLCEEVIFQVLLSIKNFTTFGFYCVLFRRKSNTCAFCIPQPLPWTPHLESPPLNDPLNLSCPIVLVLLCKQTL